MNKDQLISALLSKVEGELGRTLRTPTDFQYLSLRISLKSEGEYSLSSSTIKRLCNYVRYKSNPSLHTLSTLAIFVGYKDWHDYADSQLALLRPVSGFLFDVDDALTKTPIGGCLRLRWLPDRRIKLMRKIDRRVEVVASENSQLQTGDSFILSEIKEGEPLLAVGFVRDGTSMPDYVMGRNGGISII